MLVGTQVANAHDMPSRFPLLRHWSRTDFFFIYKTGAKLHFHAPIGALVTEALVTRYSKGEVTLKSHLWTLDRCSHTRLERNTNSNRILVICHELLTNSKKVNSSLQHFCPHARRLGFSFAILKARYSFRLYIHINIPENKTKMVFIYWFIWFYTSSYILKMMQKVCIIASEARWWCRWWGWPQLKPTTHDQPQRIP